MLVFLRIWTDRRTDGRTDKTHNAAYYDGRIITNAKTATDWVYCFYCFELYTFIAYFLICEI